MQNDEVTIIAGPCSVDESNEAELYEASNITVKNRQGKEQRAVAGVRVVGLKSRTSLNEQGDGMGMDYEVFLRNTRTLQKGGCTPDLTVPPSVEMAKKLTRETGVTIATEVMAPLVQLPLYERAIGKEKMFIWNPAVEQLGWPVLQMREFAQANKWNMGLKNPKWVGENLSLANKSAFNGETTMEKTWAGLYQYAGSNGEAVLIHRGVDVPDKGDYRNLPVHEIAKRVKRKTGAKLYFDPSHSHGPKMRGAIVPAVVEAMQMKADKDSYLYDGILVEAGTSQTDTEQHISLEELRDMAQQLAAFRDLALGGSDTAVMERSPIEAI